MRRVLFAVLLGGCTGSASPDGGTIFTLGDGGSCSGSVCTVDDLCPCVAPWESHAEYVLCIERAHALLGADGGTSVASAESNACGRCNGPVAELFMPAGTTTVPHAFTTIAVLADGTVLVAGGEAIDIVNTPGPPDAGTTRLTSFIAAADRYDPIANRFAPTGSLITARGSATATTLQNGKVLVVGGVGNGVDQLASAELYDPASGTFSATGSLNQGRTIHTATLLADGRVLIAGGYATSTNTGASLAAVVRDLASAEVYDPTAGTFAAVGSLATGRNRHSATLLADGTVLIAGGHATPLGDLASAERFNPTSGMFTATGSLIEGRRRHGTALLANGSVLIAGGTDGTAQITTAEIYTPSSGTFASTGPLGTPREDLAALTLPDGQALFIGGDNASGELASAELYDPNAGVFFATGALAVPREFPVAALLTGGDVLVVGGDNAVGALDDAEIYQPVCQSFVPDGGAPIVSDMMMMSDMITPPDLAAAADQAHPDLAQPDLSTYLPDLLAPTADLAASGDLSLPGIICTGLYNEAVGGTPLVETNLVVAFADPYGTGLRLQISSKLVAAFDASPVGFFVCGGPTMSPQTITAYNITCDSADGNPASPLITVTNVLFADGQFAGIGTGSVASMNGVSAVRDVGTTFNEWTYVCTGAALVSSSL